MATMVEEVGQSLTERGPVDSGTREERIPDPCIVVIFGASGDLTKRKLLPALFHLEQQHLLPKEFVVVGVARRDLSATFAPDMQDGVLNLCRVKLRDQQRLAHGPLKEYTQFGQGIPFGEATPRAGNDSGGGQPGVILKCKGWETDPNAYIYFITQAPVWEKICDVIGEPGWKTHPDYAKPPARLSRLNEIFARIEQWTMTKTKFEAMEILNKDDIPCGPILSMKEIAEDQSLRATGTVVEVDHPTRGKYISVGNPIKLSDSPSEVERSPLLGEHTDEILRSVLGFSDHQVADIHKSGALEPPQKQAAE